MQEARLVKVLCRALFLGTTRASILQTCLKENADLAACLEQVMAETENYPAPAGKEVTLEEIDTALVQVAANSGFSSPDIKRAANGVSAHDILQPMLRRLRSSEAKWLVRMILKSYSPANLPEHRALRSFHFLLPDLLAVQDSFEAAVAILEHDTVRSLLPNPPSGSVPLFRGLCAQHMVPKLGVIIKRTPYYKARSLKHCRNMADGRRMSVERKYDGEYCQVHIDKSNGRDCIRIFSKSGKDSTIDRVRLHGALEAGLRLDRPDCAIRGKCILEGELLVWSQSKKAIMPFHTIRKHVMHGGTFIGNDGDSPRRPDEQLMIMFYDILLLDDNVLISHSHSERRRCLEQIVRPLEGEAGLGERELIDFGAKNAKTRLCTFFAHAIARGWEGLVLKGSNDPYFSWKNGASVIKLKKDYMDGFGDTVDLCIVGGRRDQNVVDQLAIGDLSWTSFYIACLENKEAVRVSKEKPLFRLLDVLSHHGFSKDDMLFLNRRGRLMEHRFAYATEHLDLVADWNKLGRLRPTSLFKHPFVVEVMGAGFEKPSNMSHFVLRFPRVKNVKLHTDRLPVDTNTFDDLQRLAKESLGMTVDPEEREEMVWIERLIAAEGAIGDSQESTQSRAGQSQESHVVPLAHSPHQTRDAMSVWTDTDVVPLTEQFGMPPNGAEIDSISNPQASANQKGKRKLEESDEVQESGPMVKRQRKPELASTLYQPDITAAAQSTATALGSRAIFFKPPIPARRAQGSSSGYIKPFEPPAVFRTPNSRSQKKREPLSEVSTLSPQRPLQRPHHVDLQSGKVRSEDHTQEISSTKVHTNPFAVDPPKGADLCPTLDLSTKDFAKQVLCSHWLSAEGMESPEDKHVGLTCPTHRLMLIRYVDKSRPNLAAHEIRATGREVLMLRKEILEMLRRGSTHQPSATSATPKTKQQKMVMFYDLELRDLISTYDCHSDGEATGHSAACVKLRSPTIKKFFAGCLLFTTSDQFCSPAMLSECGNKLRETFQKGQSGVEKELDMGSTFEAQQQDTMTVKAIWDWEDAMALLPDL